MLVFSTENNSSNLTNCRRLAKLKLGNAKEKDRKVNKTKQKAHRHYRPALLGQDCR